MKEYVIDKRFKTSVQRSGRVLEVAEAFGLGLEDREFVVYDKLKVPVKQGDVVYITGQSGSGKSLLLRELVTQISQTTPVANIDHVQLEDRPLIDQIGQNCEEAIRILNLAGLNDAYLFIRRPSELSDGQLYRFKVAKLLASGSKVIAADEFGAVLDRVTAKTVAFNVQKFARLMEATLIVATTHEDLHAELAPNVYVHKRFQDKIKLEMENGNN